MVPLELLTVPLDFFLILLVNGTPTAQCTPMVIDHQIDREQRESFVQCQVITDTVAGIPQGAEFTTKTTDLIENMDAAFTPEGNGEITIQLTMESLTTEPIRGSQTEDVEP